MQLSFLFNGSELRKEYYDTVIPAFAAQREKIVSICKKNPELADVKVILLSDLMEAIVCKKVATVMKESVQTFNGDMIRKEVSYYISKELMRRGVGHKIPLIVVESQKMTK